MFSKSTLDTPNKQNLPGTSGDRRRSVLHDGISIKGNWTSDGIVEFGGTIVGDLTADVLVLTPGGRVTGNVRARSVTISGRLDGTVSALSVAIKTQAEVTAEIVAEQISIEPGAQVGGKIRVTGKSA